MNAVRRITGDGIHREGDGEDEEAVQLVTGANAHARPA
jgi:hypothetical protein